jgi:carboxymethylenebutenolidase
MSRTAQEYRLHDGFRALGRLTRLEAAMKADAGFDLGAVFDAHMSAEFELRDADKAMETMTDAPSLTHVPVVTGARGKDALRDFYRDHFVGKWPSDLSVERISRTTTDNMVIDEFIVRFTHDIVMDAILPGLAPTGRRVELPHVAVVGFENGKIAFERIYWDQGSMLVQLGLIDVDRLPLVGSQQAAALLHEDYPRNELITG